MFQNRYMYAAAVVRHLPAVRGRGALGFRFATPMRMHSGSTIIKMNLGHLMEVPLSSHQTWNAAFTGSYDDPEVILLSSFVRSDDWALDVGASLGFYTVPLAIHGRVVAVEPVAGNRRVLQHNLNINRISQSVQILPIALGSRRGCLKMEVEVGGAGNAALTEGLPDADLHRHRHDGRLYHTEMVDVMPLDDVSALPSGRCSVVKLDVEGFELDVLAGAAKFLAKHRPVIFGEFSPEWLASRGAGLDDVPDWATKNNYGLVGLKRERVNLLSDKCVMTPTPYIPGVAVLLIP